MESTEDLDRARLTARDETAAEQLDRNSSELMAELRVAATGIQVLFAFLLIVPFNAGWRRTSSFDHGVYFVGLICIAIAAALLIAPTIHHRLLFRRGEKAYLLGVGTRFAVVAAVFLSVGLTAILILLANVVFGTAAAAVVGVGAAAGLGVLWFALPLIRRRHRPRANPA